jgi:UDP-glucose:(heptosyl)LPS alpha-1,3-glucosyltransferase
VSHGGAENVLSQFVGELTRQGHTVHIFASQWKEEAGESAGIVFHRVPVVPGGSFFRLISFAFFTWLAIRKEKFDIIFSFERTLCQDVYRAGDGCHREWLHQRKRSKLKRALMRLNPFHSASLLIEKEIYTGSRVKKIIANSRRGKEEIIRHYGTPSEKIEVIYNGVDLNRFHPANRERYRETIRSQFGVESNQFLILFVGSGFERKGLGSLIEAAGILRQSIPSFKLLIAGKGDQQAYLKRARRVGIEKNILFIGTFKEIAQLYAAGDVMVLPTLYDPFANVCLEAMASGLPVITTRINGASELLEGPLAPLILEQATDAEGLAKIILSTADRDRRTEWGELSRKMAERFPEKNHFNRLISVYNGLLS